MTRYVLWLAQALAIAILVYFSAQLVLAVVENDKWQLPTVNAQNDQMRQENQPREYGSFDPFFRTLTELGASPNQAAPESTFKVAIFGLRANGDGTGSAIIKTGTGRQTVLQIGENLAPGVLLAAVYRDRIEITRRGLRETIYMKSASVRQALKDLETVRISHENN